MALTPTSEQLRPEARARLQLLTWEGSDAELLELAHRQAPQAAAKLYDRFSGDVNRVIFRLVGPDSERDDLVQDTFLRVFRHIQQVQDPSKLGSWVVSVAVNVVLTDLKKRKLRRWLLAEKTKIDPSDEYGDDHEARQLLRSVFEVLDAMPVGERTVFALRYLDERTMNEVAALTRVSLPTAKRSLAKAVRRFEILAARMCPGLLERFRTSSEGGS